MRILLVLCALLAIAVTSSARSKNARNATERTTIALPSVKIKHDSSSTVPESVEKSNEKFTTAVAIPIFTTADPKNNQTNPSITSTNALDALTSTLKDDTITVTVSTKKVLSSPKATIITTASITDAVPSTTTSGLNTTTPVPLTTTCPPLPVRRFDGLSFLGGIILTVCLTGVGLFLSKYCQSIREDKYRTL